MQDSLRRINAQRKLGKSPDDLAFQRSMAIIYGLTAAVLFAGLLQGAGCKGSQGRKQDCRGHADWHMTTPMVNER